MKFINGTEERVVGTLETPPSDWVPNLGPARVVIPPGDALVGCDGTTFTLLTEEQLRALNEKLEEETKS